MKRIKFQTQVYKHATWEPLLTFATQDEAEAYCIKVTTSGLAPTARVCQVQEVSRYHNGDLIGG